MNIAYVTDQLLPQTATDTQQMMAMVAAFGAAGASVTLIKPEHWFKPDPDREAIAAYYRVEPAFSVVPVRSVYPSIRGLEKVAQGLVGPVQPAARRADVIYTRTLPILLGALLFGDRPVVYETYRPWPDQQPASRPLFRWIGRHPRFLGAVLHSQLAADSYAGLGLPRSRLLTAYNGYDPSLLAPVLPRREARRRCGLPSERPLVVYAGRMTLEKGLGLVLEAAEALPHVDFVLVGSEGYGPVERRADGRANVRVVPWQAFDATVPYLYAADVLLIPPSRVPLERAGNTVLPLKTFLYMAAGRAILAPNTPDVSELLVDRENALLVQPDDVEEMVRALRVLLGDDALRRRLGEAARRKVQGLTWDQRARTVLHFIAERLQCTHETARAVS